MSKVKSAIFDAEGMDAVAQECQSGGFEEQETLDCANWSVEGEVEGDSIGNGCRAGRREDIGDVALGFEVFDEFVGRGTAHHSSMMSEFACRATVQYRKWLESVNRSAEAPGWVVEEVVDSSRRLDM